jgi:hypothetical protein
MKLISFELDKKTNDYKWLKGGDDYRLSLKAGKIQDPKKTQANMLPHDGLVPGSERDGQRLPVIKIYHHFIKRAELSNQNNRFPPIKPSFRV